MRVSRRLIGWIIWFTCTLAAYAQTSIADGQRSSVSALESSQNPHLREHAYLLVDAVWLDKRIPVCWDNPSSQFTREMGLVKQEVSGSWQQASGLQFVGWGKCAEINKGIRIRIDDSGPHTKGLGRGIDGVPAGMVLNFTFNNWSQSCRQTRDYCIKAIAGHEFGHAIGFAHEQNRPDKPGECREAPQGTSGDTLLTPYDPHSIMNYCNAEWNNSGQLSALDIDAVRQVYGTPPGAQ